MKVWRAVRNTSLALMAASGLLALLVYLEDTNEWGLSTGDNWGFFLAMFLIALAVLIISGVIALVSAVVLNRLDQGRP